ncbi:MAG: flagellar brake protein [Nitrospinae bacterium]|nr:flagellar brake protein [Nitrospinota bacterium]
MGVFDFLKKDAESNSGIIFSDDLVMATQIRKNLEYVCQKNTQITVAIDERLITFRSIFLEVGAKNDFVVIDVLIPEQGNHFMKPSSKIKIDYTIEGIMYSFESKYIETISGRFSSIKIEFPSVIMKIQRRRHFRVSPPIDKPITVKLTDSINEKVADISEGGVAIYTRLTEKELTVGKVFEKAMLSLPTVNQNIMAKTVVRSLIKGFRADIKNKCGMEFMDMRMHDKDLIASYVLTRQREIIQKQNI